MAVREFVDGSGREWRVWEVIPETIHPQTKTEDYLADIYRTGWLVFETKAEDEKRRHSMIPPGWSELPDKALEGLLRQAEVIPQRRQQALREARGGEAARQQERAVRRAEEVAELPGSLLWLPEAERPDVTDLGVVRTLQYPGGGHWKVSLIQAPERGGGTLLRFASGERHFDVREWPRAWADYPDERLVELLREAAPRAPGPPPPPGTPRRRWDDRRA